MRRLLVIVIVIVVVVFALEQPLGYDRLDALVIVAAAAMARAFCLDFAMLGGRLVYERGQVDGAQRQAAGLIVLDFAGNLGYTRIGS